MEKPAFWNNTKRYYDLKSYWRNLFGGRVYKLPIDAGFTCPNRDGTVAAGGCIYCDGTRVKAAPGGAASPCFGTDCKGSGLLPKTPPSRQIHCLFSDLYEHVRSAGPPEAPL